MAGSAKSRPISLLMPPPNVTGALHLGHALNNWLQDALVRFFRLRKQEVIWVPGFDHAGIATEIMVQKWIKNEQFVVKTPADYARLFAKWTKLQQTKIRAQWKSLDLAINSEYETFTFDPAFQIVVQTAFCNLYAKKLVYQAKTLVNWDPILKTAIADIEVEHRMTRGKLYYIKYALVGTAKTALVVATTRPETIFADQAVFIHPDDKRYQQDHHKFVINPLTGTELPILTDQKVTQTFGSGVLKCTPGHDWIDWELGKKWKLKAINCFDENGKLNELGLKYATLDRFTARAKIIADLQAKQQIVKIESYEHKIPYSSRSGAVIEPFLSTQWFLKTQQWAAKIRTSLKEMTFIPGKYRHNLINWVDKMHDWCLSRQLHWGHRLPVYYHRKTGAIKVSPNALPSATWAQSSDVLDTWFSSGLWALANSGWNFPARKELNRLYPFTYLITSYDIIFFWVIKMLFFGLEFKHQLPFTTLIIHGLIRTSSNEKMSKSRGNVVNPLKLIEATSLDAVRWTFLTGYKIGDDWKLEEQKIVHAEQFKHKIANIAKFLAPLLSGQGQFATGNKIIHPLNAWLWKTMTNLQKKYEKYFLKAQFALVGDLLSEFIYKQFSNFYLLFVKGLTTPAEQGETRAVCQLIWKHLLVMLHPFMSKNTTTLYQTGFNRTLADFPREKIVLPQLGCSKATMAFFLTILQQSQTGKKGEQAGLRSKCQLESPHLTLAHQEQARLNRLLATQKITITTVKKGLLTRLVPLQTDCEKTSVEFIKAQILHYEQEVGRSEKLLQNTTFQIKAPKLVVEQEKKKALKYKKALQFWKKKLKLSNH